MFIGSKIVSIPESESIPKFTTNKGTKKITKKITALRITNVKNVIHIFPLGSLVTFLNQWLIKIKSPIDTQFATNPIIIPYKWEVDTDKSANPKIIKKIEINVFA